MSTTPRQQAVLHRLLNDGSLPESVCSRSLLDTLSPLLNGGVVVLEKSGAGRRLAVRNHSALSEFLSRHFPQTGPQITEEPLRVQGAARFRNTKALRGTGEEIVCVRGWRDGVLLRNGMPVAVVKHTHENGLLAFLLRPDSSYELHGRIATVENPTLFHTFERLHTDLPMALYIRGRMSKFVLSWLARQAAAGLEIVHFGDYDPVGLDEYLRLLNACDGNVDLHIPANLRELFCTYGKPGLLRHARSQILLNRLRQTENSDVQKVLLLIDETNSGLEQEAILIGQSADSAQQQ